MGQTLSSPSPSSSSSSSSIEINDQYAPSTFEKLTAKFNEFVENYCETGEDKFTAIDIMEVAIKRFFKKHEMYEDYLDALKRGWQIDVNLEILESVKPVMYSHVSGFEYKKVVVKGISLVRMP